MPIPDISQPFPRPDVTHPVTMPDGSPHPSTVFLSAVVNHPRLDVGDYTYASSFNPPDDWAARLAPYLFEFSPERLSIGRFCQIADGATFITASANHRYDGVSSFPFAVFGGGPTKGRPSMPDPGPDTVVGHDVWIGQGAKILPGARIGSGAIVGAGAVVAGNVGAYAVVAGNPARTLRHRFGPKDVQRLLRLAWWDWPIEAILTHEALIACADIDGLARVAPNRPAPKRD